MSCEENGYGLEPRPFFFVIFWLFKGCWQWIVRSAEAGITRKTESFTDAKDMGLDKFRS
ncbi:MAG: hypothetical protein LBT46_04120 [Planctomycetaceae bacterium]|nr:hypothetical protein [Planctomycetaceae bacterium]